VSQAAALQEDLRRARIEPYAWVLNQSVLATGTRDPLLQARLDGERRQVDRLHQGLAQRVFTVPWMPQAPVGLQGLTRLLACGGPEAAR
jgi:arsenite-transporting ATPase